ncbi:GIY-YIG nuclease family protein [bacterium]|nr:GIY-YIG nuclease family protein [bacterium]MBT7772493.1 GIY-YIG nuclease family protein [bacterium]
MFFYVYVLKSLSRSYFYVGMTNNLERRFAEHSIGKEKTTRFYRPFKLVFSEKHATRIDARKREKFLKSGCGKEWIKQEFR